MKKDNQQPSLVFKELKEDNDYIIYSDGKLYSKKTSKFLKGKIDNVGYHVYAIQNLGKTKMLYSHRLVAQYFIDNPENKPYVNHKDGNKLNNDILNLEWVTPEENMQHYREVINKKRVVEKSVYWTPEDDLEEKWKVIPEHERYSVSDKGRVKNNKTQKVLKNDTHQKYTRIQWQIKGKTFRFYIHRLVYTVFNNDYELGGFVIDHIDGNPKNNHLSNLQKITFRENNLKQERFND